jgi:hypothetical protein
VDPSAPDRPGEKLEVLRTLLESASRIAVELASGADPVVGQLCRIVRKAHPDDLNVLLAVLEREIDAKADADLTAGAMTGLTLRPNPNARLYTRVIEREPSFDRHEVVLAAVRAVRGIHHAAAEKSLDWQSVAQEALRASTPAERESVAKFCRVMLAFIESIDRGGGLAPSGTEG